MERKKQKLPKNAEPYKFKPGQSGNPSGRPKALPNVLKKLTRQSLKKIIRTIVKGNLEQIKDIGKDPNSSALEVAIAASFAKAIEKGDYATVEHILQRVLGKIPDEVNVNSRNLNLTAKAKISKEDARKYIQELEQEI